MLFEHAALGIQSLDIAVRIVGVRWLDGRRLLRQRIERQPAHAIVTVSYTHLDVYKRQVSGDTIKLTADLGADIGQSIEWTLKRS